MNRSQPTHRTHIACWCLIASAVVLSGLLVTRTADSVSNEADAALVIARDNFSLLTARTRSGEESLFILDNRQGALLVYNLNVSRKRLELVKGLDLNRLFSEAGGGDNDNGGGDRRGR
ncbi:MAG: hypothetical protein AAF328_04185 [Planctomycetota bacterium]